MNGSKVLIVNADDFGQSPDINRGVIEAHEKGIVTSASLMVRWPAAAEAVDYVAAHPELSLGLHLDLAEWAYQEEQWVTRSGSRQRMTKPRSVRRSSASSAVSESWWAVRPLTSTRISTSTGASPSRGS